MMRNRQTDDPDAFYEVEIDGVTYRISKERTAELRAEILAGEGTLTERLNNAFQLHPNVETDATEESPPIGNEPEEIT